MLILIMCCRCEQQLLKNAMNLRHARYCTPSWSRIMLLRLDGKCAGTGRDAAQVPCGCHTRVRLSGRNSSRLSPVTPENFRRAPLAVDAVSVTAEQPGSEALAS